MPNHSGKALRVVARPPSVDPGPAYAGAIDSVSAHSCRSTVMAEQGGDYLRTSLAHLVHETVRRLVHLLIHPASLTSRSLILSSTVESGVGQMLSPSSE